MDITLSLGGIAALVISPSVITGFMFWLLQRRLDKDEKERQKVNDARKKNEVLIIKGLGASIALGEACATALKNGHSNGETTEALEYVKQIKHQHKDFMAEQSIDNLY